MKKIVFAEWEEFDDTVNRLENHVINLSTRKALIIKASFGVRLLNHLWYPGGKRGSCVGREGVRIKGLEGVLNYAQSA